MDDIRAFFATPLELLKTSDGKPLLSDTQLAMLLSQEILGAGELHSQIVSSPTSMREVFGDDLAKIRGEIEAAFPNAAAQLKELRAKWPKKEFIPSAQDGMPIQSMAIGSIAETNEDKRDDNIEVEPKEFGRELLDKLRNGRASQRDSGHAAGEGDESVSSAHNRQPVDSRVARLGERPNPLERPAGGFGEDGRAI